LLALLILTGAASRVAGHLSRQLSRPLDELVRWTDLIGHGESLPPSPEPTVVSRVRNNGDGPMIEVTTSRVRGAPEFETLRRSMREMVSELEHGRMQAVEAERLQAFRETARRVAHEIKNPLTPIRFALARLRGHAPQELQEDVDVIAMESERLDRMAKSFAEFGKLPEGRHRKSTLASWCATPPEAVSLLALPSICKSTRICRESTVTTALWLAH
jgi:signal transduction histidine kinase